MRAFVATVILWIGLCLTSLCAEGAIAPLPQPETGLYDFAHLLSAGPVATTLPLNSEDPYGPGLGVRLAYEYCGLPKLIPALQRYPGLYFGTESILLFHFPDAVHAGEYGASQMLAIGLYLGWRRLTPIGAESALGLSMFAAWKQYLSWHVYQDNRYFSSRPVAAYGLNVDFFLGRRSVLLVRQEIGFYLEEISTVLVPTTTVGIGLVM